MHSSRMHTVRCSCRLKGRGISAQGDFCLKKDLLEYTPPVNSEFLTHACENIAFTQLHLWTVKIDSNEIIDNRGGSRISQTGGRAWNP